MRGRRRPIDIFSVLQPGGGRRCYGFLSIYYGLMANLDRGTEHLRRARAAHMHHAGRALVRMAGASLLQWVAVRPVRFWSLRQNLAQVQQARTTLHGVLPD